MKFITAWFTLLIVSLLCMAASVSAAASPIGLFLNGKPLAPEVAPRIVNDNTIVPIRIIAESLGSKVSWEPKTRAVTVTKGNTSIQLIIDKKDAVVNGKAYKLEAAPTIIEGNTMLPVRFVSEQFGVKVTWDETTRSVNLINQDQDIKKQDPPSEDNSTPAGNGGVTDATYGKSEQQGDRPAADFKPSEPVKAGDAPSGVPAGGKPVGPPAVVQGVLLKDDNLTFQTTGGTAQPNIFYMESPERIVIDLSNAQLADALFQKLNPQGEGKPPDKNGFVSQIRYSLFSKEASIVRIVIDLPQKTSFKLNDKPGANEISGKLIPVKNRYKVVIDPGHGGKDTGAISVTKRTEKEFVLALSTKVAKAALAGPRYRCKNDPRDDTFIELADRASFANDLKADLFVAVHANSASKETIGGTETYYYSDQSLPFAQLIHKYLVQATGFADRKVKQDRFYVIKNTNMPSVLVEVGFLTNRDEDSQMYQDAFQDRVAASIVVCH
ncbi:N-acetylmuramoyl-L-alanine amidase family protein [Paenibacillus sp. P26]|nr:N-acetylmuramoyl-L-alanine amidase family protein [Paenibacillus sp. P26]